MDGYGTVQASQCAWINQSSAKRPGSGTINAHGFRNVWLVGNPEVCHPNEAGKTFRSCVVSVLPVTRQSIGCPRLPDR
jgi:hypothetical protein